MPFAASDRPALGTSLLKAHLQGIGVPCDIAYLNLAFAELMGRAVYERFVNVLPFRALPGEWVFAECLYGSGGGLTDAYVEDVLLARWKVGEEDIDLVRHARDLAAGFLATSLKAIPWGDYGVVGFSSFTAQNLASLALAKLVKHSHPEVTIVFGGANWQGIPGLELHRRFPFVDFALSGEADHSFPEFVRWIAGDARVRPDAIPGLIFRRAGASCANAEGEPIADLDALPTPDHSDFYAARHRYPGVRSALPSLAVEASRGCWWATTGPCTFCGMDGHERVYRAKSGRRVIAEMRELSARWPCSFIHLTDTVVSPDFLDEVLPQVASEPLPARLFFEVRPTVTRQQVEAIAAVRAQIQPGIESLNDHLLRLMHKGTRALENIRLLKWCKAMNVSAHWNILHGLPGETEADYQAMFRLLPAIRFLDPPRCFQTVSVDRYSPYFERPDRHGLAKLSPLAPYRYLYPFPEHVLADIAYAFECGFTPGHEPADVGEALERELDAWRRESPLGELRVVSDGGGRVSLRDTRAGAAEPFIELDELQSLLYEACDEICDARTLQETARRAPPGRAGGGADVVASLAALVERRLMVQVDDRYLSLALPRAMGG